MSGTTDPQWYTNGFQNNPAGNTVLADTGPIDADCVFRCHVIAAADATVVLAIQHRNAANNANLHEHRAYMAASSPIQHVFTFTMAAGERVRVLNVGALTGNVCVSISGSRREAS